MSGSWKYIDNPGTAALAASTATDPNLSQAAGPGNEITAGRLVGNEINDRVLLCSREQLTRTSPVSDKFDDRDGPTEHPDTPLGLRCQLTQ
jgi:hypothetical protein